MLYFSLVTIPQSLMVSNQFWPRSLSICIKWAIVKKTYTIWLQMMYLSSLAALFTCLQAYKDVTMILERHMKRKPATTKARLNVFYVLSAICRQSKKQFKDKDKYGT